MNFPKDFNKCPHKVVPNSVQFLPKEKQQVFISVVGGGVGLYGNGETSFELMIGNKVHGYLSAAEVNKKINEVLNLIDY